jgi:LTXXQ motif family protein
MLVSFFTMEGETGMKKVLMASVTTLLFGLSCTMPSSAQMRGQEMGMMGGRCPMMNMMAGGIMDQGMMDQGTMDGGQRTHMVAMAEGRLAYLKSELAINKAQSEAWDGYAKAVKAQTATMQEMHANMANSVDKGTAVERIDARIKGMQAMTEALGALKPATVKLYDALTPEQKKTADDLIGVGCGGM